MLRVDVPHHSTGRSVGLLHREAQRASRSKEVPQAENWAHHEDREVLSLANLFYGECAD